MNLRLKSKNLFIKQPGFFRFGKNQVPGQIKPYKSLRAGRLSRRNPSGSVLGGKLALFAETFLLRLGQEFHIVGVAPDIGTYEGAARHDL